MTAPAARHRAVQVAERGGALLVSPVEPVSPGHGQVRIDVVASGICGADTSTVAAPRSPDGVPVVPGHEVAGVLAEVGDGVEGWAVGDRVALGWFGGSCGHCPACRSGDVVHCPARQVPGLSYPGGWSTTVTAPAAALARVPEALPLTDTAPFGCAGVTTFNALRTCGAPAGSRVAIAGLGGLGHLAVQISSALGHETVVVGRGKAKEEDARALGADAYVDAEQRDIGAALRALGGVALAVSTASSGALLAGLLDGLDPHGRLVVVGVDAEPFPLPLGTLVSKACTVSGHLTGSPTDTEAAMRFAVSTGVRPWTQLVPLDRVQDALGEQQGGRARYRMVLTTDE